MLQNLSDKELLNRIEVLVKKEKEITIAVIEHLQEIQERRLFAELGYSSLFAYCTKHLKYSDSDAYYRINSMKLTKAVPAAKEKISSGELSLTNATKVFATLKECPAARPEKLLEEVCGKSKREAEIILNKYRRPEEKKKFTIEVDEETYKKFEEYRREHGNYKDEEIINKLFEQKPREVKARTSGAQVKNSRYIPAAVKRNTQARSGNCCEFISPITGKRCEEKRNLEYDHKKPFAKGGTNSKDNIRLLCKQHNLHAAVKEFGQGKMQLFI